MIELIDLKETDYPTIKEIFDYYILNSTATFFTEKISIQELKKTVLTDHPKYKSYLVKYQENICGFCYFSQFKKRQAYDRTAEVSVYLKPDFTGKGIGIKTLQKLEKVAINQNIIVLVGTIACDNKKSQRLFERCGFEKCAHFKQVGEKFGKILDVVVYQKMLIIS
jgi:phosphinothricin acetyltransferase